MAADRIQTRTISHTGSELGSDMVDLTQNQVSPQRESAIASFECPRKFESITYAGRKHYTKAELRGMESFTVSDDDASGTLEEGERTLALSTNLRPVAGEEALDDQPFESVQAVNVTQSAAIENADLTVDYAANEVVVAESAVADGDEIKVYPVINEGSLKIQGVNQFGQVEGPADKWSIPLYRFSDFDQDQRGREINLQGRIKWSRYESIEYVVDSPRQVVWTDADYPHGSYVSHLEQRVDIEL